MEQEKGQSVAELALLNSLLSVLARKKLVSLEEAEGAIKLIEEKVSRNQQDEAA